MDITDSSTHDTSTSLADGCMSFDETHHSENETILSYKIVEPGQDCLSSIYEA